MKILCCITVILVTFYVCSMARSSTYQENARQYQQTDTLQDTTLYKYLIEWRKDSTGCLKIRNQEIAEYLIQHINLIGKIREDIEAILGKPNDVHSMQMYIPAIREDREFIFLQYYFDIHCVDGEPTPNRLNRCWIEVVVHPDSRRVVDVGIACS